MMKYAHEMQENYRWPQAWSSPLPVMRQQAIKAIREGQDVNSVAAAYGVNVRSVFRRLADFANGGQNALLSKPIPGRAPKLSADEMRWLAQAVRDHTPLQFKFVFGLWVLSLIAALFEREFGKKLSLASVSRIMKLLGFSAQKPLYIRRGSRMRRWSGPGKRKSTRRFVPKPRPPGRRSTLPMNRAYVTTTARARPGRRWARPRWWK